MGRPDQDNKGCPMGRPDQDNKECPMGRPDKDVIWGVLIKDALITD